MLDHLHHAIMPWHDKDNLVTKDAALLRQLTTLQTQLKDIEDPATAFTHLQGQLATFAISAEDRRKTHLGKIAKLLSTITDKNEKRHV